MEISAMLKNQQEFHKQVVRQTFEQVWSQANFDDLETLWEVV
jgi:hypothetical protein